MYISTGLDAKKYEMKKAVTLICALLVTCMVFAQAPTGDSLKNISVTKDPRIALLVKKNRDINEEVYLKTRRNVSGYRLQVINTNDRTKAISIKTKLLQEFPEEKIYLIYQSPYFKIQMGNFKSKPDAEKLLKQVNKVYPNGVFVVPAKVELKPTKDGELLF